MKYLIVQIRRPGRMGRHPSSCGSSHPGFTGSLITTDKILQIDGLGQGHALPGLHQAL
jgi:hypothetical protein